MDHYEDSAKQNAGMQHGSDRITKPSRSALIILLMISLVLAVNFIYRLSSQSEVGMVRFIIDGESGYLDEQDQAALSHDLQTRLADIDQEIQRRLKSWEEDALDKIEKDFNDSAEQYLDWYFSLAGSYARLGYAALGDLEPWMEEQLHQRLVKPSGFEDSFKALREEHSNRLLEAEKAWLSEMLTDLHQKHLTLSARDDKTEINTIKTVNLDQLVKVAYQDHLDAERWSASQVGGGVVGAFAGKAIVNRLSAGTAMKAGRTLMRSLITRVGLHATRSMAIGGTAAAVSAPSGPGALVVGASAVGTSFVLAASSEYAALKVQERLNRPQMESELKDAWSELEDRVLRLLQEDKQARAKTLLEELSRQALQTKQESGLPKAYRIIG